MPVPALKNMMTSIATNGASADLGLGDQLQQQVQDEDEERKKKLLAMASQKQQNPNQYGDNTVSPAVMSLFGKAGGYG